MNRGGCFVSIGPDDKVVGHSVVGGRGNPDHEIVDAGWINSLVVESRYRRQGLGAELLDASLRALVDLRINRAMLYVLSENAGAIALYKSRGFEEVIDPHPSGLPRVTMETFLSDPK